MNRFWTQIAIVTTLYLLLSASLGFAAEFQGLGFLTVGDNTSRVSALSPDGSTIVGDSQFIFNYPGFNPPIRWSDGSRAFRWSAGHMTELDGGISASRFTDVPNDVGVGGRIVLGARRGSNALSPNTHTHTIYLAQPYVWTASEGRQQIQRVTDHGYPIHPSAISRDGSVWVGESGNEITPGNSTEAFRYTMQAGPIGLGFLPGGDASAQGGLAGYSSATGVSADGNVVVGYSASARSLNQPWQGQLQNDDGYSGFEAFVWTPALGMIGLGDLPGSYFNSHASAVSANGRVVVGSGTSTGATEAFRWTSETAMVVLGFLNADAPGSTAVSTNANGSIVVGQSIIERQIVGEPLGSFGPLTNDTYAAFIWDSVRGMRNLKTVLEAEHGLNLTGWQLTSAVDISEDGLTIAGNGINPEGQQEGWFVRLEAVPEPATIALVVAATVCAFPIVRRHRRKR